VGWDARMTDGPGRLGYELGPLRPDPRAPRDPEHERTRAALWATREAFGAPTCRVEERDGVPVITCLVCGSESAHPADVTGRSCGFCGRAHRRAGGDG
jgi:hypothetical protein